MTIDSIVHTANIWWCCFGFDPARSCDSCDELKYQIEVAGHPRLCKNWTGKIYRKTMETSRLYIYLGWTPRYVMVKQWLPVDCPWNQFFEFINLKRIDSSLIFSVCPVIPITMAVMVVFVAFYFSSEVISLRYPSQGWNDVGVSTYRQWLRLPREYVNWTMPT